MSGRLRPPRLPSPKSEPVTVPVVVTLDMDGGIADVVGDLGVFVSEGDTAEAVVARLSDLTSGEGNTPETLAAVELSDGRFADIHILAEDESRHFVLLDVSAPMRLLQKRQQLEQEAELGQRRIWMAMGRDADDAERSKRLQARKVFRQSAGLLETVSMEMREPLSLLSGHVRILARRLQSDPVALRSLAAMQHAAMRLDALSSNALIGLGELSVGRTECGVVELGLLAGFLQDAFALQAEMRGVGFEICTPGMSTLVEVDDLALRRLLVNLVVHALDGMEHGLLRVSLSASDKGLEIELEADPGGLPAQRFGELVTTVNLLRSNTLGNLVLAASQCLLQRLDAAVELVERREGGHLLWFRLPVRPVLPGDVDARSGTTTDGAARGLVAISLGGTGLAERMVDLLGAMEVPVIETDVPDQVEVLLREGGLRAMVLSGASGLLHLAVEALPLLVVDAGEGDSDSWCQDGRVIRVPGTISDDALREALTSLLA